MPGGVMYLPGQTLTAFYCLIDPEPTAIAAMGAVSCVIRHMHVCLEEFQPSDIKSEYFNP